jgi:phage terminase large subunit GpA-like protein
VIKRHSTTKVKNSLSGLLLSLALSLKPKKLLSVSQWADSNRILSSKGSGEPGKWSTDRTPYLRDIMDALSVTNPVQRVVLMFGAQIGKTEVGLNWIGYVMDHAPAPMLVVVPTLETRKRWVRQRLDPLLNETPVLRKIVDSKSKRDAGNSEDMKDFPGGMLVIGGANSPASLASMPIRFVMCDEVDRFPWEVGEEGDPLGLIDERTKTFPRRKVLLVSTPTVKGLSRIEQEYLASDMREYHVPCPHCGDYQVLKWRHDDGSFGLVYSESTNTVWYACRSCGADIHDHHKTQMLAHGRWIARHPEREVRGYHLNGLYSPIGLGFTWYELWQDWKACQGDTANLKRFINTTLGEVWEEPGEAIESASLLARCEVYPDSLPIRMVVAGVDVQGDRIEAGVYGFGDGEECWALDHVILDGDPVMPEVWDDLDYALGELGVQFAAIDSGHLADQVYAFVEKRRWCVAIKGVAGMNRPLVEDERKRKQRLRHRRKKGHSPENIGVDSGKAIIYGRLKLIAPGAGYIHYPVHPAFDDVFFEQLTAEKLVTKTKGGRPYQEWVQIRKRNEALDIAIYALSAYRIAQLKGIAPRSVVRNVKVETSKPVDLDAIINIPDDATPIDHFSALLKARKASRHG